MAGVADFNLREIVERPNGSEYTTEEMQFVVERYIMSVKGKEVTINLGKNLNPKHPMATIVLKDQFEKLNYAFGDAQAYFVKYYNSQS